MLLSKDEDRLFFLVYLLVPLLLSLTLLRLRYALVFYAAVVLGFAVALIARPEERLWLLNSGLFVALVGFVALLLIYHATALKQDASATCARARRVTAASSRSARMPSWWSRRASSSSSTRQP